MQKKILFLIPYPLKTTPSQRFRFEQYIDLLREKYYQLHFQSFFNADEQSFFRKNFQILDVWILMKGFIRRFAFLFKLHDYDFVFIHREAAPVGPPIIEWCIAKIFRKKILYDFDDAIWLTDKTNEPTIVRWLKYRSKVAAICKMAYRVSCGNEFLVQYAKQFNNKVVLNPTTIDTVRLHCKMIPVERYYAKSITIGWTGSHSTLKYLMLVEDVLHRITKEYPFVSILVIADSPPNFITPNLEFRKWSESTEIDDLLRLDIGIMPLPDDEWSKGKCGFKILQYMALGIPAIASSVGENKRIIHNGVNGLLCDSSGSWYNAIKMLIESPELRKQLGNAGHKTIKANYSVSANSDNFLRLFS